MCTPITGQPVIGVFMKYSYEFKVKCVEMYQSTGLHPDVPNGVSKKNFFNYVHKWSDIYTTHGKEDFRHSGKNRYWNPTEKFNLITEVKNGKPLYDVAVAANISTGQLRNWIKK